MDDEVKILWMFKQVYGEDKGATYAEVYYNDYCEVAGVNLMKHGNVCWGRSKLDLVFDFLTKGCEL